MGVRSTGDSLESEHAVRIGPWAELPSYLSEFVYNWIAKGKSPK